MIDIDAIRFRNSLRGTPGCEHAFVETAKEDIEELCRFYDDYEAELEEEREATEVALGNLEQAREERDKARQELALALTELASIRAAR